jgi:hypothetical protein
MSARLPDQRYLMPKTLTPKLPDMSDTQARAARAAAPLTFHRAGFKAWFGDPFDELVSTRHPWGDPGPAPSAQALLGSARLGDRGRLYRARDVRDDDRRPEFQRMLNAATTKPPAFDIIVVPSFSYFFRDQFELEFYIRRLAKNRVRFVSYHPGTWRRSHEYHYPADHGPVRRVQAHIAGHEGERPARLLQRLAPADGLPHRGGG